MQIQSKCLFVCAISALFCLSACVDIDSSTPAPQQQPAPAPVAKTTQQAVTSPTGPNWFVAGGLNTDLVGEDGEPDSLAGRYVNGGTGVTAAAANSNGWLVVGPTGSTSWLDGDGKPQRGDLREVLSGKKATVVSVGSFEDQGSTLEEFFVGGADGEAHIVDPFGEPKQITSKIFMDGQQASAAAFNMGARSWLVGGDGGQLLVITNTLAINASSAPFGAESILGITANSNAASAKQWIAISANAYSYYPDPQSQVLDANVTLSAVGEGGGKVVFGSTDGKVAFFDFDAVVAPTWKNVLNGQPVKKIIYNGSQFLLLSTSGFAQVVDDKGDAVTQPTRLGDQSDITSAYWSNNRWLMSTETSFVLDVNDKLEPNNSYPRPLEGSQIYASDVSKDGVLVVGADGKYRFIDTKGQPKGNIQTLGTGTLRAASWSGSTWIIGGDGGKAQILNESAQPEGAALDLLGGKTIETASWNGVFWLLGGQDGQVQRVRKDGTIVDATPKTLGAFDHIYSARWNGREWMVVGVKDNQGAFQLINSDLSERSNATTISEVPGPFHAVDWNGREWFMGGVGGLLQIASSEGVPRTMPAPIPRDMLNGKTIYTIDYHKESFLLGGEAGLVRKIPFDLNNPASPVSVLGFADVRTARWSAPRGFGGNECLTSDVCYSGPCLGDSLATGFCCDATCDRPCESCEEANTGQPNGTCAPIKAGNRPSQQGACQKTAEADCGFTGFCDGAGECQNYGPEISCQAQSCSAGVVTGEGKCDGQGACTVPQPSACNPYATCSGVECATECVSSNDCIEGYRCVQKVCELIPEAPPKTDNGDDGCCATVRPRPVKKSPWLLLLGGFVMATLLRRRVRR